MKGEGEGRGREDFRTEIANGKKGWVGVKEKRRGNAERKGNREGERGAQECFQPLMVII